MRAGRLDRRVTLQRRVITRDAAGGAIETWTSAFSCWAERRDVRGSERLEAGAEVATHEATFRIRWRAGIDATWRLVEGTVAWDVEGIAELGRRDGLELTCRRTRA